MASGYSHFKRFSTPTVFVSFKEILFWCLFHLRSLLSCIPRKLKSATLSMLIPFIERVLYCIVLYCIMRPYTDGPIGPLSYRHSSGVVRNPHSTLAK